MMKYMILALSVVGISCSGTRKQQGSVVGGEVHSRVTVKLPNGRAADVPPGPFDTTWASIEKNYHVPSWFTEAKFGIMMHWGLYAVPAHGSEWYAKHMYSNPAVIKWHREHFGPQDQFGYKDFIPMFSAEKFDPDAWAALFKKAGARYVIPTAEHHDGFAMYDSKLTRWDAKDMGPKRDLIGDLATAVRKQGLKFGVSNHRMENWDFMYPADSLKTDLFDPRYADFYGPPQKPIPGRSGMGPSKAEGVAELPAPQSAAFLEEWLARCQELVDQYQPDIFWFDNGVNYRSLDPIKLRFAAYYYNRAKQWGKEVSISTKSDAYLAGTIKDFERQQRAPQQITDYVWQVDDPVLYRFGYTEGSPITTAKAVITKLVNNVSRNGNLLLNISPKADGTIPDNQQELLLQIGQWLDVNGEAIYGTHAWSRSEDPDPSTANGNGTKQKKPSFRFTVKGDVLYAVALDWPGTEAVISSLPLSKGRVSAVSLLGTPGQLKFQQDEHGLRILLPSEGPGDYAYSFRIEGAGVVR